MKSLFKEYGIIIITILGGILFTLTIGFVFPALKEFVSNFIQTLTGSGKIV